MDFGGRCAAALQLRVRFRIWLIVSIFVLNSNGCATSEDLFWKLDALQSFIRDLHWPEPEFRTHLNQRLKLMACDMIESCIQRWEKGHVLTKGLFSSVGRTCFLLCFSGLTPLSKIIWRKGSFLIRPITSCPQKSAPWSTSFWTPKNSPSNCAQSTEQTR